MLGLKQSGNCDLAQGQILLAWALARKLAVIPKSTSHSRLVENFEAANVQLSAEDVKRISDLNLNLRVGIALLVFRKTTNEYNFWTLS